MNDKGHKIAVAGNQWITKYLIERLCDAGYRPSLIINVGKEKSASISGYEDLAEVGNYYNIPVYRPELYSLKAECDREFLLKEDIDVLLAFGWQRLIPDWLIYHCQRGVYGVHGGPLPPPRCRGRAVFNWALLMGCETFYMYLMQIDPGVDSGDILAIEQFDITPEDDVCTLYHKNCIVSTKLFIENLTDILEGTCSPYKQNDSEPSYLPKRTPEMGGIDWSMPAKQIVNLIRATAPPYPGAFTLLEEMVVNISRAHIFDSKICFTQEPGEIIDLFPNGDFLVMTGDTALYVREYTCDNIDLLKKGLCFEPKCGIQPDWPEL